MAVKTFVRFVRMVSAYGGDFDVGMAKMMWIGLTSPHYTLGDLIAWLRGANRGSGPMELVVFEESAHTPFMAEPEEFNRALLRVKEETWRP